MGNKKNTNLISVSGPINSGKDTVGKIIQIITGNPHFNDEGVLRFLDREIDSPYEIKKFAGKLKEITCLLLGCTIEDLENREFKESELEEEWDHQIDNLGKGEFVVDGNTIPEDDRIKYTYRTFMQRLGTEAMRNMIHPQTWVNALMGEYKPYIESKPFTNSTPIDEQFPKWLITDTRFPNEIKALQERNALLIKTERPYSTVIGQGNGNEATFNRNQFHPSETALDSFEEWDYIIENDSDLISLVKKVREILIKESII